jgi:hypothetical protein
MPLIHEIEESPWSRDQYVDSLAKTLYLLTLTHSTEHDGLVESCVSSIRLETLLDLDSKLSSGSDDENLDLSFSLVGIFFRNKELDDRNRECSSLARTGLSQSLKVSTPENGWDRLILDRSWRGISLIGNSSENRFYDREFGK